MSCVEDLLLFHALIKPLNHFKEESSMQVLRDNLIQGHVFDRRGYFYSHAGVKLAL